MRISDWSSDVCSSDLPEFGSRTDPASNLQLTARCVYAIKNLGLETVADVDSCSDLNLLKQYGISRVRLIQIRTEINRYLRRRAARSEEHTSELQSLMRISYAVFCLKKKNNYKKIKLHYTTHTTTQN